MLYMDISLIENVQNYYTRRLCHKFGLAFLSYVDHLIFLDREVMRD
jgi:hypothetical protein